MDNIYRGAVRFVFLAAYGAFLFASVKHISFFFSSFEPSGSDWFGAYWLAISIDVTALVLTIGIMFFSRGMGLASAIFIWFFVICLTAFSWLVNWEYAAHFQSVYLTQNPTLTMLNPILASSFAFLNLAYSIVSNVFTSQQVNLTELQAKAQLLEDIREAKDRIKTAQKGSGIIAAITETVKEIQGAAVEILGHESEQFTDPIVNTPTVQSEVSTDVQSAVQEMDTLPEHQAITNIRPMKRKKVNGKTHTPEQKARTIWTSNPHISARALAVQVGKSPTTANTWLKKFKMEQSEQFAATGGN